MFIAERRIIVNNWSETASVLAVLFGLIGVAFALYLLLPALAPWRDPDPKQFSFVPSRAALWFLGYLAVFLAIVGLAIPMRIALALRSPLHWWALPAIVVPPLLWLSLAKSASVHMAWGNVLELPLLGLVTGVFVGAFGGFVRTWRSGAYAAWIICVAALLLWTYVPKWA